MLLHFNLLDNLMGKHMVSFYYCIFPLLLISLSICHMFIDHLDFFCEFYSHVSIRFLIFFSSLYRSSSYGMSPSGSNKTGLLDYTRALLWAGDKAVSKIPDFTKFTSWSRDKLKANKQD